ncbi:MAG TPA: class I SAM-dependent methyltransferase [Sandaracinaceae bacterium LLY-WYZ-13_1]|nr:class I SAM-dependent methyltransferase [Sandaracinaceae bacterium LLY-WYZ-13_1]
MTYDARLYALVHDGAPGDVAFYRRLVAGARPAARRRVLELGSGWGRVARALAEDGHDVVGLERDAGMLAEAERQRADAPAPVRRRLRYVEADMAGFSLDQVFDRIVVPFTGIYCLPSDAALRRCLASVRAHLAPGGLFAFDAYDADPFHAEARPEDYPDDRLDPVAEVEHEGETLTVLERSTWDRDAQRLEATYVYRRADGSVLHEASIGHRYLLSAQVRPALEAAGLALASMHGDFDGTPYAPGAGSLVVTATRDYA